LPLEAPNIFITVFAFVMLIGTLVVIHELGHYLVGRYFGVKAERFSIGVGPQIYGRVDKRGTLWRIGALPLGGYVQFAGDANAASMPSNDWQTMLSEERDHTFHSKTLWQRALIIFAGPAVNFIFAIIVLSGFLLVYGQSITPAVVGAVQPNSAAASAEMQAGDKVLSINGVRVETFQQMAVEVSIYPNEEVELQVERDGVVKTNQIRIGELVERDRFGNEFKRGMLGLAMPEPQVRSVGLIEAPWIATKQTGDIIRLTVKTLGQIISGRRSVKELGGPLKIAKVSGETFALGITAYIWLAAMISINLGFMNLLPIPMLDGGHLMLYAIEAVRRRPSSPQVQEWAFRAGFLILVSFMLMVTFNDLASFGIFTR
jgi:regulator of sigma E protease